MRDYFGTPIALHEKKLFLFDMDGTIYKDNRLFDGTKQLMAQIRRAGGNYVFITNNSSKSVTDYVAKVTSLGIDANASNFFTSAQAAALLLRERHPGKKVYCLGTRSLVAELRTAGIRVTELAEKDVEIALVGFDTELTSEKLRTACEVLGRDVAYYATNPDLCCPVEFGFIPDCGSICGMLRNCTGKEPAYIGKPEPLMVEIALSRFHACKEEAAVVGDRLYTDIAVGLNAGITSICVLTGEATPEEIKSGDIKPTYTFSSVKEIYQALYKQSES